jgi:hypothetical protein
LRAPLPSAPLHRGGPSRRIELACCTDEVTARIESAMEEMRREEREVRLGRDKR